MPAVLHHQPTQQSSSTQLGYEGYGGYNRTLEDDLAATTGASRASMTERTKRTWDGVFLPVSLSIFGFVLFARLPWMIGECGLWLTLVGIVICFAVTFFTTLSLAAISTNGFTGDGGPYMMISRCLGPQIGTTVGVTFVLANSVATAMYLVGGSELVVSIIDNPTLSQWHSEHSYITTLIVSSLMLLLLLLIACLKVEKIFRVVCLALTLISVVDVVVYILRVQDPPTVMPPSPTASNQSVTHAATAAGSSTWGIGLAPLDAKETSYLGSPAREVFDGFTGLSMTTFRNNWDPAFSTSAEFQKALAVLFPGVSGLMSGVCLSGDLRNGAKAIPRGIGYAWSLSFATYIIMAVLVGGSMERSILRTRFDALRQGASDKYVFGPGEFVASFAAGLSMMVGSARVLRAIARDRLLPFSVFQKLADLSVRRMTLLYWLLIQLILLLGNTYTNASIVASQVFCANFLALNLSTFLSSVTGIVSFRPVYAFFNTTTALCGALLCCSLMFFINPLVAIGVLIFMALLLVIADMYIDPSKISWGDASQPLVFYVVRKWLLRLDERKEHIRHWRPSILHVVTDPLCSLNLIHVTNNLKKGGLYELCLVLEGTFHDTIGPCFQWKGWLMDFIATSGIKAFAVVTCGETMRAATQGMLRTCGLGGMRPNTVLLSIDEVLQREYFGHIYDSYCAISAGLGDDSKSNFGNVSTSNMVPPTHEQYKATLGGGTQDTFGTVRPLKDVNNRATEFWDLKRNTKGEVVSANTVAGGNGRRSSSLSDGDERSPLLLHAESTQFLTTLSSTAIPVALSHQSRVVDAKRSSGLLAPPSPTLPRGESQRLSARSFVGRASFGGHSSLAAGARSTRASACITLDPADEADELAQTMALDATARQQQRQHHHQYVNRAVHFADFEQHTSVAPPSEFAPSSPEFRHPHAHKGPTDDPAMRFLHATQAAIRSGSEHTEDDDVHKHIAFSLTRTAVGLLNSTMHNSNHSNAASSERHGDGGVTIGDEPPRLPITRTATAIFNEQMKKRRSMYQPSHRPLPQQHLHQSQQHLSVPQAYHNGVLAGSPTTAEMAPSSVQAASWAPLAQSVQSQPRAGRDATGAASWSAHALSTASDSHNALRAAAVEAASSGPPSGEGGIIVDELAAVTNLIASEAGEDIPMLQSFEVGGEDFPEVMSVASTGGVLGGDKHEDVSPRRGDGSGSPAASSTDEATNTESVQNSVVHTALLRMLQQEKRKLQAAADGPVAHHADGPELKTREGFRSWMEKTMQGSFAYRPAQQKRSPPPPSLPIAAAVPAVSTESMRSTRMPVNGSNTPSGVFASVPTGLTAATPPAPTSAVDTTIKFLEDAMAKAHEMKVPFGWGLFRAPHTFESKVVEQQLLERMIAQRHAARLTGEPDLCHFTDITEFCSVARDVSLMQMNLLLARNMDKLNMAELADASKRDVYVDVWVPHDSDAILFLLSYCFSMTSVWKKRGTLRIISVVTYDDEIEDERDRLAALLREHRMGKSVLVVVISLEVEAESRKLADPALVVNMLSNATGRAEVLNSLMRREVESNGSKTAMIFVRVASYLGPDVSSSLDGGSAAEEASEDWFANLLQLSNQLPPMLLLAAGSLKCRSSEW